MKLAADVKTETGQTDQGKTRLSVMRYQASTCSWQRSSPSRARVRDDAIESLPLDESAFSTTVALTSKMYLTTREMAAGAVILGGVTGSVGALAGAAVV